MENIFTVSKPFILLANIFGIFPMSFEKNSINGVLKVTWHGLVNSVLSMMLVIYIVASPMSFDFVFFQRSKILMISWTFIDYSDTISCLIIFCCQLYKSKNIFKFLKVIDSIDQEVINF